MKKNAEDLAAERALAFYWALENERERALISVAIVVVLPLPYIYQDGWVAGLWFLGAGLIGLLISTQWKRTHFLVKVFGLDTEYNEKTERHMKEIDSGSKSQVAGALIAAYVLALTLVFPGGNPGTQFPNGPEVMLLLSGLDALLVYFAIQGPDIMKAFNLKKIARTFNVSEQTLIDRINPKLPPARPPFSITLAAVFVSGFGAFFFLFGGWALLSSLTTSNVLVTFRVSPFELAAIGVFFIFFFGGGGLLVAYKLRKMSGVAAVFALFLCLIIFMFSLFNYDHFFGQLFLKPLYINFIWWWGIPVATALVIWRNWKNMRWPEELKYLFAPWELKQEKQPEEFTET